MKSLHGMTSAEILTQDFLRCNSYENLSDSQRNQVQKAFTRAQAVESILQPQVKENDLYKSVEEEHIYETIEEHIYETIEDAFLQKAEIVFSERVQSLSIEGKFKKKDAKNIQRIEKLTQTLVKYNPGQVNFDVHFNMIMGAFKKLKTSSGKLAAFVYLLDATKGKEGITLRTNKQKLYKELPKKYKKLIRKSNPRFSIDMYSNESAKSIAAIRAHLQKRSIFVNPE